MNSAHKTKQAARKRQLIAEGAILRAEIIHTRSAVQAGLQPVSLARNAAGQLMRMAAGGIGGGSILAAAGLNWQRLLPLAITGFSALSKKSVRKPVLRIALALGIAGAAAALIMKAKTARRVQSDAGLSPGSSEQ